MLVRRGGVSRIVTEDKFERKFKALGYEKVEEAPADLTKKEIMERLDEQGIEYNPRSKKAELLELLG